MTATKLTTPDLHSMIEDARTRLTSSLRYLDMVSNVLLGHGYIVLAPAGFPLSFTVKDGVANSPVRCRFAGWANRFTQRYAEAVAAEVKDGSGQAGRAVHVREAIEAEIVSCTEMIEMLEGALADTPALLTAQADLESYTR
jgi:hypothetical protein